MHGMHVNWKGLAGVAHVATGLLIATQNVAAAVLPILLLHLVCPLMMLFMMGSMEHLSGSEHDHAAVPGDVPDLNGLTRDQQVWALRGEMTKLAWRQEALRHDLEQLEADQGPSVWSMQRPQRKPSRQCAAHYRPMRAGEGKDDGDNRYHGTSTAECTGATGDVRAGAPRAPDA